MSKWGYDVGALQGCGWGGDSGGGGGTGESRPHATIFGFCQKQQNPLS